MGNSRGGMKCGQNITQFVGVFGVHSARVVLFKKPFQPLVADCSYHPVPQRATWRMSEIIVAGLLRLDDWRTSRSCTCSTAATLLAMRDGVYKSTDAGKTWQNMGLKDTQHIARII